MGKFFDAVFNPETYKSSWNSAKNNYIFVGLFFTATYFLIAALIPILYIKYNYTNGGTFIKFYSHLYLYPAFYGWISMAFLIYPIKFIFSKQIIENRNYKRILMIFIVSLSVTMLTADIMSSNPAPFEVKPNVFETSEVKSYFNADKPICDADKKKYQDTMNLLLQDWNNWSVARGLHYISILIQILSLFIVGTSTITVVFSKLFKIVEDSPEFRKAFICCLFSVLISYLWLFMYVSFDHQKLNYFPSVSNPAAAYVIIFGFIFITITIPILLITWFGGDTTANSLVLVSFAAASSSVFFVTSNKEILVKIFGKDADILNFFSVLIGVFIFIFLLLLIYFISQKSK